MAGVLHSNRSLLLVQLINSQDEEILQFGIEAAWRLVVDDGDKALAVDSTNFKASFRRARALFELGDLDDAYLDATRVVEHYARNSATPNPDAVQLREEIQEALRKERHKLGQVKTARWNRATKTELVAEVTGSQLAPTAAKPRPQLRVPWADGPATAVATPAAELPTPARIAVSGGPPAPRNGGDVEKALLVTCKNDSEQQLGYVREHLQAKSVRKFWRNCPLGADLLGLLVRLLADTASDDDQDLLRAIGRAPSTATLVDMFNAEEKGALQRLQSRVGAETIAAWTMGAAGGGA